MEYRKGSANGNADFLSRLPPLATDLNRAGPNRLTSPNTVDIYLIHACDYTPSEPSTQGVGLGGLVPPSSSFLVRILTVPYTDRDVGDFRRHGSSMDISGIRHPSSTFVASATVQDPAGEPPCSASADPRYVQDPAAESPCSASVGPRYVQDPATGSPCGASTGPRSAQDLAVDSSCSVSTGPRTVQDPAGHLLRRVSACHFSVQDSAVDSPSRVPPAHVSPKI